MTAEHPTTPFVVLGDDLSPGADLAWLWTCSQRWSGWTLIDLQAETPAFGEVVDPSKAEPHPLENVPPRSAIAEADFAEVRFLAVTADPRVALNRWPDAALIVVGEASGGIGPRRIGSTTEWLMREPTNPVLLARRGRRVRRAMVCADGSPHAAAAVSAFVGLPWASDVEVHVTAVDDGRTDTEAAVKAVRDLLDGRVESVASTVVLGRSPHREILAAARSIDPDLIVLGTRGLTNLRALTLGSTASAVATLADCSVLVNRTAETA